MVELIICEKPAAMVKVATALADTKPTPHKEKGVSYYTLKHKKKEIIVGCAVGHLFLLDQTEKNGWTYPVFNISWSPTYKKGKNYAYTKKYFDVLKKLAKEADEFTVACDYDAEGSVIGRNCLKFICKKEDGKRMKFSTLTKDELIKSYEKASKHLDFDQIEAGETRHYLDYYWGINLSRALTLSIKNTTNYFKILSIGRVQGPTLKLIVDKEKEIQAFKPETYWEIYLNGDLNKKPILAKHKKDKFKKKTEVDKILKNTKGKEAKISDITKKEFNQAPPTPFDLTSLQIEAYRCLKTSPKETLKLGQELYIAGMISYPRTSSQKLPKSLNYKKLISEVSKQPTYKELCNELLKSSLTPNEGKKNDPAHPAIHPTGEKKEITGKKAQLYDLIVRRFLATFSVPAKRETVTLEIDCNKEKFISQGTRTVEPGWHKFYGRFAKFKEEEMPDCKKEDKIKERKIKDEEKQTQPPKRYTPASLIKIMESKNLGTKATRSSVLDALYTRNYVKEQSIQATILGIKTIDTLEKYCPDVIDEELTVHFENELKQILDKKKKQKPILDEAKKILIKILEKFKKKEKEIGKALAEANLETRKESSQLGPCPKCKNGNLRILYSKKTKKYFAACDGYPKCKTTFSLPQGLIQATGKVCPECGLPVIKVIRKGKRPFEMCLTYDCKTKEKWNKKD
ncbi:MAG: DNA topoisomerase I [Nanoarchaeota archaeon]|nr:DNA topoisomerase I [Nanoarchaeota archaeon]